METLEQTETESENDSREDVSDSCRGRWLDNVLTPVHTKVASGSLSLFTLRVIRVQFRSLLSALGYLSDKHSFVDMRAFLLPSLKYEPTSIRADALALLMLHCEDLSDPMFGLTSYIVFFF